MTADSTSPPRAGMAAASSPAPAWLTGIPGDSGDAAAGDLTPAIL